MVCNVQFVDYNSYEKFNQIPGTGTNVNRPAHAKYSRKNFIFFFFFTWWNLKTFRRCCFLSTRPLMIFKDFWTFPHSQRYVACRWKMPDDDDPPKNPTIHSLPKSRAWCNRSGVDSSPRRLAGHNFNLLRSSKFFRIFLSGSARWTNEQFDVRY